ncbi:AtpZ/AtpI family protein [Alkaliphilus peptidifermentans]|uniref:Putative F0F1-ATPase subunit Ca2+/Mg2+ transporter n=1 Tax=Alkaliphilus peptidifermentans DSM 18978 TaxID=1120976 RepID=A0A1G5JGY2_9FIRM|nr:AtpZ/AtpI family protein [Alkaliphilus peptidifermentans]SCY87547.1 Putative F0F1-ATPase subunit Ca2+/Mg2+ transporter [Alkaliphilus peptidifermentans DSM 18978]
MAGKKGHMFENLALISYIGISMIVPIIGGVYLGRWIDSRLNSQPIFLFVLIIMGVIVAFMNLFKVATKDIDKKKRK